TGVHQRRRLFVDAGRLAIHVGRIVVGVHNLQLIAGVAGAGGGEEEAGVAAGLAFAGDVFGDEVFEVELVVGKAFFGFDVAGGFEDGDDAVVDGPLGGGFVLDGDPLIEVVAVEEDDGVGGRSGRDGRAGGDHFGRRLPLLGVFGF